LKIYAISGLGADKRVFDYLNLDVKLISVEWIEPIKNEKIIEYCKRLSEVIDTSEKFCLLGVSYGGLIATEISKFLKPELTILISSAETNKELRWIYKWFGKTKLVKLFPEKLFDPPRWIAHILFGTKKKKLLSQILDDTDLNFAKWAVGELITWENETRLNNVLKINGTRDKLIPPKGNSEMILIDGGEHLMIVDRAEEISMLINKQLNKLIN